MDPLSQENLSPGGQQMPEGNNDLTQMTSKRKKWLMPSVILLAIVVLGAAAFAGWFIFFKKNNEQVKKDIALVRWTQPEKGLDVFYPDISNNSIQFDVNRQIFEGLVQFTGRTTITPLLATSWTNPDGSTWLFTLKQGVKFHTGRTMTAEDVKTSIEAAKNTDIGKLFATTIKAVDVTSDGRVKITTNGPDPILLNKLPFLSIFDTKSGKKDDPINGTGPYELKSGAKPTDSSLKLVAFNNYHGGHVYTRELDITYATRQDEANAFDKSQVDVASIDNSSYLNSIKNRTYGQVEAPSLKVALLGLNHNRKDSPLANLKVRQALYLSTDVPAILKARGQEGVATGQIVPKDIPGYNSNITRPDRDVAKAKQLLTEAGYPQGTTLTFTYFAAAQTTAEEIAKEAKDAGIILTLDPQTDPSVLGAKALGGKTDVYFVIYSTDTLDAMEIFTTFYQGPNYETTAVDELINQANATLDPAKRLLLLQQIEQMGSNDVVTIPLFNIASSITVYNSNYRMSVDVPGVDLGVYFWKVYAR